MRARPLIGVIGSGGRSDAELAGPLGVRLAQEGLSLITGGGGGVMAEVARAFATVVGRRGLSLGVLPAAAECGSPEGRARYAAPPGYPNPHCDLVLRTHLPQRGPEGKEAGSRNHIIVLSATAVIALPGDAGTQSEIELTLEYGRPLILFAPDGRWARYAGMAASASTVDEVMRGLGGLGIAGQPGS